MIRRLLASLVAIGVASLLPLPLAAQVAAKTKSLAVTRTADGHPDLQGVWTNATITPMERPAQFNGKLTATDEEAAKYEKQNNDNLYGDKRSENAEQDRDHAYNALFFDRGTELARVDGVKRTSLIIDPPDGKIPAMTPEAKKRNAGRLPSPSADHQRRPTASRAPSHLRRERRGSHRSHPARSPWTRRHERGGA